MSEHRTRPALVSIFSNTALIIIKVAVGLLIGSVAIISEAVHSGLDLIAAIIAFFALKKASKPADKDHPFGHGKYENISAFFEAFLILVAAVGIVYESARSLRRGGFLEMESLNWGLAVMLLSGVVNWFVSAYLFRKAKELESPALDGDAWHLRSDVITCLGVLAGLAIVKITGYRLLDPIMGIMMGLYLCWISIEISWRSIQGLVDKTLPPEEEKAICGIIDEHYAHYVEYHSLKTRRSGSERHIALDLVMSRNTTTQEAHDLCDHLERDLQVRFPAANVFIHIEPCDHHSDCDRNCTTCEHLKPGKPLTEAAEK
jgi:cation diffusion facilitator family transporter